MKKELLQPVAKVAQLEKLETLRYLPGFPRAYRFDAKKGILRFKNEMDLTRKGESFSFIPISFRIFSDEILNFPPRRWAEMLFVNQAGQVCAVLFHGFSVERLQAMCADLYYEDVSLCELALTVTPEPRSNEHGSYFVATFSYQVLKSPEVETLNTIIDALPPLYREETLTGDAVIYTSKNYHLPEADDSGETPAAESSQQEAEIQPQRA